MISSARIKKLSVIHELLKDSQKEINSLDIEVAKVEDEFNRLNIRHPKEMLYGLKQKLEERTKIILFLKECSEQIAPEPDLSKNDIEALNTSLPELSVPFMQLLTFDENAIFLFADMKNFTITSQKLGSLKLVKLLNEIYSNFQTIISKQTGIEIVKPPQGDCIILHIADDPRTTLKEKATMMVKVACELSDYLFQYNQDKTKTPVSFRFGISMGEAAKVHINYLSERRQIKKSTDYIGPVLNFASRLETTSHPNFIQISANIAKLVKDDFELSTPNQRVIKSLGKVTTYFVIYANKSAQCNNNIIGLRRSIEGSNSAPTVPTLYEATTFDDLPQITQTLPQSLKRNARNASLSPTKLPKPGQKFRISKKK